jgi:Protein of unknown function (DUF1007)
MRAVFALTALLAMFLSSGAEAHPHIWISQSVRVVETGGKFTQVEIEWRFDPFTSEGEIALIDSNKDGRLSPQEVSALARTTLPALQKDGYMTWLNTGDKDFRPPKTPTFAARIDDPASFLLSEEDRAAAADEDAPRKPVPGNAKKRGPRNLVYIMRFDLPGPEKFLSITTFDPEDFIRVVAGKPSHQANCTIGKHPTYKSEFVPGRPVFADVTSCRLP